MRRGHQISNYDVLGNFLQRIVKSMSINFVKKGFTVLIEKSCPVTGLFYLAFIMSILSVLHIPFRTREIIRYLLLYVIS